MIRRNPGKQPSNRAVGYVRRSTDRQEQSIDDQKKALQDYAIENNLKVASQPFSWYADNHRMAV